MIISPILSLSLLIILIIQNKGQEKISGILKTILFLIENIGLKSLRYILIVLGKLFMEKMFVSHIKLMTYIGVFGIIFSLIANSLSYLINFNFIENPDLNEYFIIKDNKKRLKNIFDRWGNLEDNYNWLLLIGIIILWFIEKYVAWYCIYTFSPNHYTIYASINSIVILFIELVIIKINIINLFVIIISSVALCGIIFCGLIFNEIIIIRLWELEKYTNVEIDKRQKEETKISMIKCNEYNSNYNSNVETPENSFDSDNLSDKRERISS